MTNKEIQAVRRSAENVLAMRENGEAPYIEALESVEDVPKLLDEIKELTEAGKKNYKYHQKLREEYERLQKDRDEWKAKAEQAQAKLNDIDRYGTQNEHDWKEKADNLQEENERLQEHADNLERQLEQMTDNRDEMKQKRNKWYADAYELRKERDEWKEEAGRLSEENEQLRKTADLYYWQIKGLQEGDE